MQVKIYRKEILQIGLYTNKSRKILKFFQENGNDISLCQSIEKMNY